MKSYHTESQVIINKKCFLFTLGALLITSLFFLHPTLAQAIVPITVSIPPQKNIIKEIAGDLVDVHIMLPNGADPHTYEPKPRELRSLTNTKLYFTIGLPFEDVWLDKIIKSGGANLRVVPMHQNLARLENAPSHTISPEGLLEQHGSSHDSPVHRHGNNEHQNAATHPQHKDDAITAHEEHHNHSHHAGMADPHVWLSPMLVKHMANEVRKELIKIDPDNAITYRKNYAAYAQKLDALDRRIAEKLSNLPPSQRRFIVFHPAWSYFAHSYGLEEIPIELEGREPTPRQIMKVIDIAREEQLQTLFVQPQFSSRAAETIAKEINARLVTVDPLAEDWAATIEQLATIIAESAHQQAQ